MKFENTFRVPCKTKLSDFNEQHRYRQLLMNKRFVNGVLSR